MFEVGFSEMLLIMALALIVLGPEKLPKLAAQVGRWVGRARNMARQFRDQLEEESLLEETRPKRSAASAASASATTPAAAVVPAEPPVTPVATATATAAAEDDPDTRHNEYSGADYEAPAAVEAAAQGPAAVTEEAPAHVSRGA